jgi:hypothetical protein
MVAIGAGGLSPARLLIQIVAWLRAPAFVEHEHKDKARHYPTRRASFIEQAAMSREMYRL